MTNGNNSLLTHVETLKHFAPSGFALAFHINFTTPRFLLQTYREDWVKYYSENGLVMSDPTVLWGFENDGTRRWSDLAELDSAGVLTKAKDYGMAFGVTVALTKGGTRTIGSFSRPDDEYSAEEISGIEASLSELHDITSKIETLSSEEKKSLAEISVQVQST